MPIKPDAKPEPFASIPVFYSKELIAEARSFSPSAGKPALVVARWKEARHPMDIRPPQPVTVDEIARAHDRNYVENVLALRANNGFGNRSASVAKSLPWTSGSMLSAARCAIESGQVACAPCSGFHHARWDRGSGFCSFNGLMVAALALREEGLARRVGILDCDQHYGDGTDDIIERLDARSWVRHVTAGSGYPRNASRFLFTLGGIVKSFEGCDVLLYQAGADPHVDDPLGGFLDDEQLAQRDAIVFGGAKRLGIPVAWNLAGGYQEPASKVLDIHDRTMAACVEVYVTKEAGTTGEPIQTVRPFANKMRAAPADHKIFSLGWIVGQTYSGGLPTAEPESSAPREMSPPRREDFQSEEAYEEAQSRWRWTVGRNPVLREISKDPQKK